MRRGFRNTRPGEMPWSTAIIRAILYNHLNKGIKLHLSSLVSCPVSSFDSIL